MQSTTAGHVLRRFRTVNAAQWIGLVAVGGLWVACQVLGRQLAASDSGGVAKSIWWPYAQAGLAAAAFGVATLVTLGKRPPMPGAPTTSERLLAALPFLVVGALAAAVLPRTLYDFARHSPVAPSILALAALAAPAALLAFLGPSLAAVIDHPRKPFSAFRLGLAATNGMRWKLLLITISWLLVSFLISGLLAFVTAEEFRPLIFALDDLLLLPLAAFMALLYLERSGNTEDAVSQVFG